MTDTPRPNPPVVSPSPSNIAGLMELQAAERPYQRAVVFPQGADDAGNVAWTHLSFADLNTLTDEYARGFAKLGVKRGDRVSLLVKPCLEFIPLTFAIFKIGALPVLIDPGMGRKPFLDCIQRMAPRVLIGEPVVMALKTVFSAAFKSVEIPITVGKSTWFWGGSTLDACRIASDTPFMAVDTSPDDEAAILFTSGSTGPAKGVTYTHGIFAAQTRFIQEMYDIQPGEMDLACLTLFGLFSMAMGMTVVIPDMDPTKPAQADPAKLVNAINSLGCTSAFGSPAIWKNVAPWCLANGVQMPSLKRILMAGAPIPVSLHEAFQQILTDGAQIHTPYGATESLPVASIGTHEVLADTGAATATGAGTCVGHPAPGIDVRIIAISDEPIADWADATPLGTGEIGEIVVSGRVVTHEYKNEPHHTASAKMHDGDTILHRMGDVGYLDDQGRLWFCGRKSHRVVLSTGETCFSVPCEAIFNAHPAVFRSALVGVDGTAQLVVELVPGTTQAPATIADELRALGAEYAHTKCITTVHFHAAFPVDVRHNAKIHRLQLAAWAAQRPAS